jgi:hypothetical protein
MKPKTAICRKFVPLETVNVVQFQRKIQLSGLSTYPDGSPSQLILINGVIPFVCLFVFLALKPIVVVFSQPGSGLKPPRFRGFLITHNDALQWVGLLWTSDQSVAETST